jgi:hypothetical protein
MDTPKASPEALPAIRTFARDLERARASKNIDQKEIDRFAPMPTPAAPRPSAPPITERATIYKGAAARQNLPLPSASEREAEDEIPPFHILDKRRAESPKPPARGEHISAETTRPAPAQQPAGSKTKFVSIGEHATVITDTKSDRFRLFPSLFASIKARWTRMGKVWRERKTPKYTVPDVDRRKGIIQSATSKTGRTAVADHEQLRELIRRRQETVDTAKADVGPKVNWSPNTEPGYFLLGEHADESGRIMNVRAEPRRRVSLPTAPVASPARQIEPTHKPEPAPAPPPPRYQPNAPIFVPTTTEKKVSEPLQYSASPTRFNSHQAAPTAAARTSSAEPTASEKSSPRWWQLPWREVDTNTLSFAIVAGVVVIFISVSVFRASLHETPEGVAAPAMVSLLKSEYSFVVGPVPAKENLFNLVRAKYEQYPAATLQVVFVENAAGAPLPPRELLSPLAEGANRAFLESLVQVNFGGHHGTHPFIVMRTTDRAAALGGMLSWEEAMPQALAPLFATPNDAVAFVDRRLYESDVRVLKDDAREFIVYGFIDNRTLLITTDTATFNALAALSVYRR